MRWEYHVAAVGVEASVTSITIAQTTSCWAGPLVLARILRQGEERGGGTLAGVEADACAVAVDQGLDVGGGAVAVFEFDVPAGAMIAAAHSHDGYEETIYGLEGVLTWTIDGTPIEVGPGEVLVIPRGTVHHFDNTRDVDARAVAIVTPGVLGPDF